MHFGTHLIANLQSVPERYLTDVEAILEFLHECAHAANTVVLGVSSHIFPNGAVTAVLLLSESHISIHTWPEYQTAAMDAFTCGESDLRRVADIIRERIGGVQDVTIIQRATAP